MSEQYELWLKPLADETKTAVRYLQDGMPVVYDNRADADRAAKNMNRVSIHRYFSKEVSQEPAVVAPVIYDAVERRAQTAQAIEDVAEHTEPEWKTKAMNAIRHVAEHCEYFSSQDVWRALGDDAPHTPSAMGPIFQWARRNGWIVRDGYTENKRTTSHRTELPRWRSILYTAQKEYDNV